MDETCPLDIIEYEVVKYSSFYTKAIIGQTCKYLAERWRRWIRQLPENIEKRVRVDELLRLTSLTELGLDFNETISTIDLSKLVSLRHLSLGPCTLPTSLPALTSLLCTPNVNNSIIDDSQILVGLTSLKYLAMRCIYNFRDTLISPLTSLTHLDFGHSNYISDVGISGLTSLRFLNIGPSTFITNSSISRLTNLESLNLGWSSPNITVMSLKLLTRLEELLIGSHSQITDPDLSWLTSITSLHISLDTHITSVGIDHLPNIKEITGPARSSITYFGVGDSIITKYKGIYKYY